VLHVGCAERIATVVLGVEVEVQVGDLERDERVKRPMLSGKRR
jgi:hypothetical protein